MVLSGLDTRTLSAGWRGGLRGARELQDALNDRLADPTTMLEGSATSESLDAVNLSSGEEKPMPILATSATTRSRVTPAFSAALRPAQRPASGAGDNAFNRPGSSRSAFSASLQSAIEQEASDRGLRAADR